MSGILISTVEAKKMEDYSVAKSNEFINHAKYDLSVMEQRVLACMISMLDSRPKDQNDACGDILSGELSVDTFCKLCHIEKRGSIKYLKEVIQTLRSRSWWETSKGKHQMMAWIDTATILDETGMIIFTLSSCLKPYLLNLDRDFTSYKLPMVLRFSSRYSNIIYDLIQVKNGQSFRCESALNISVDELKNKVKVEHYDKKTKQTKIVNQNISFKDLRTKILEPSVEDINKYTDIFVELDYIKNGRKIETVCFRFRRKSKEEMQDIPSLKDVLKNQI
jgi:plasmid replication initiation protein